LSAPVEVDGSTFDVGLLFSGIKLTMSLQVFVAILKFHGESKRHWKF
jgi:hypothetical protein